MIPIPGTVPINAPWAPTALEDKYPTHLAIFGKGGLRSVDTIEDRDAIPELRREYGMLVCVKSNQKYYRLEADLLTWTEFTGGGGPPGGGGAIMSRHPLNIQSDANGRYALIPIGVAGYISDAALYVDGTKAYATLLRDGENLVFRFGNGDFSQAEAILYRQAIE